MKSKLIVVCMFLVILCSLSAVSAQDIANETQITQYDNDDISIDLSADSSIDASEGSSTDLLTSSSTGSFDDLQAEINNANSGSTLYLEKDYKGAEGSNIKLDKSLTIDGKGHTLDCGNYNNCKAFTSENGVITLQNLIIANGHDDKTGTGGAILITGSAKYIIINCTFKNNWADDYGGAIYNNVAGKSLTIINSTFYKNDVDDDDGGAIYSKGEVTITNSKFEENTANIDGGAIYVEKPISVYSSSFSNNKAKPEGQHICYGGAICAKDEVYVQDCIFNNNFADDDGGAIYAHKSAFIKNSTFTKNNAYDAGGAIYKSGSEYLVIQDSNFTENSATTDEGGAIYCAGKVIVSDSTFLSNTACDEGGAIFSDSIQFSGRVSFIKNSADDDGGAIYTHKISNYVENLYFESNTAKSDFGGAIFIRDKCGDVSFYNSTFVKNSAIKGDGGAICSIDLGTTLHLIGCVFSENYANEGAQQRRGGAVYCRADAYVSNCTFYKNWAEDNGGAIFVHKTIYVTANSRFIENYAKDNEGGAIWCDKLYCIEDSIFIKNRAENDDAGAIYVHSACKPSIKNSYFESNYCKKRGGAIYLDSVLSSNELTLTNNAFISNKADDQGDDVFHCGKYKTISGNWWGTNSPSFSGERLMEYHTWPRSNEKHEDSSYNTVKASADVSDVYVGINNTIKITFAKSVSPFLFDMVNLSSNMKGTFADRHINGNSVEVTYAPQEKGNHKITIKINSQTLTVDLTARDFSVYGFDLVKDYGDSKTYYAIFKDEKGNYLLSGKEVVFMIGSSRYWHNVSDNGVATFDEVLSLRPGVYEVKAINTVTGEFYMNKITVLPRNVTYNINDTFIMKFANIDSSDNSTVTFKIAGKTFESTLNQTIAFFQLDVPAGNHTIEVIYKGSVIQRIDVEILNQYSKSSLKVSGDNYAAFLPIYNNETFTEVGTVLYSEIGENMRRYVFPEGNGLIVYNVTVSSNDEFNKLLKKMNQKDYYVDVTIINLKKGTYTLDKGLYRDQEWNYHIHLTHGSLYINGNGATIDDNYNNNFITIESGCDVTIQNLTFTEYKRVFVNNGDLLCKNCKFIKNEAQFISTETPGSVIYNKHIATFEYCTLDSNKNYIRNVGAYDSDLQGAIYADANSLTNFVGCEFKNKDQDTLRAVDGSMVILYDDDDTNYKLFTTGVTSTLELGSCLDWRPISSYKLETNYTYSYNNLTEFVSDINYRYHDYDASTFTVNLERKLYSIVLDDYEKIASPLDFRTYNREHTAFTGAGPKDNMNVHHRYLVEVGSRPMTIYGNGATISLTGSDTDDENHFAFVPNYSSLTLINMTITGFNTAIVNYGELIIINCTFHSNVVHYGIITLESENGGAIRNYGQAYFYNTTFKSNRATEGAAYFSKGASALGQFYNCTFKENTIKSNLVWNNGDENTLFVDGNSVVKIINCKGIGDSNIKKENGGVVLYRNSLNETVLNIVVDSLPDLFRLSNLVKYNSKYDVINATIMKGDYSVFPDSKILFEMDYGVLILSGEGARIFVNSPKDNDETQFLTTTVHSSVIIIGLTIEGFNIAVHNKGGLNIFNSTFNNNKVDYNKKEDYGGAIVNDNGASVTIYNSSFSGNYAKYGGAVYNSGTAKVFISNFTNNEGYDSDSNVDIFNNQTAVSVFSVGHYPDVKDKFPRAAWKQDLLYVGITLSITLISAGASMGISAAGIGAAHIVNLVIGASVGAAGGALHGYFYSSDHHDYSTFTAKLIDGINRGIGAVTIGENIYGILDKGYIVPISKMTLPQIQKSAYNKFLSTFMKKFAVDIAEVGDAINKDKPSKIFWSLLK